MTVEDKVSTSGPREPETASQAGDAVGHSDRVQFGSCGKLITDFSHRFLEFSQQPHMNKHKDTHAHTHTCI